MATPASVVAKLQSALLEAEELASPVDCVLSDWGLWENHPTDPALEIRFRTIVTNPANGGAACGPLSETRPKVVSPALLEAKPFKHPTQPSLDFSAGGSDWVDPAKILPPKAWTTFIDSAHTLANHAGGVRRGFRKFPLWDAQNVLYQTMPRLIDINGQPAIQRIDGQFLMDTLDKPNPYAPLRRYIDNWSTKAGFPAIPYPMRSGPRGVGIHHAYMSAHGHSRVREDGTISDSLHVPLYVCMTIDGIPVYLMRDGSTIVDRDHRIPLAANSFCADFSYYLPNRKLLLTIDGLRGALQVSDRTNPTWTHQDVGTGYGKLLSVRAIGDKVYTANGVDVTETDFPTGNRRMVCSLPGACWIDYFSNGDLCVATWSRRVHRVNPRTGAISTDIFGRPLAPQPWVMVEVNRSGSSGVADTIWLASWHGENPNTSAWRIEPTGAKMRGFGGFQQTVTDSFGTWIDCTSRGGMHYGDVDWVREAEGHYIWFNNPHEEEGLVLVGGSAQSNVSLLAIKHPSDTFPAPYPYDHNLYGNGHAMVGYGGTLAQKGTVPSFTCLMGLEGNGGLVTSDHIADMAYVDAYAYVLRGMCGSRPRTLTKAEAWPLLHYFYFNSQRHLMQGRSLLDGLKVFCGV